MRNRGGALDERRYHLVLRPLPAGTPVANRLRWLLKVLLRSLRFRCVEIWEEKDGPALEKARK